jgi:hypothetical protein
MYGIETAPTLWRCSSQGSNEKAAGPSRCASIQVCPPQKPLSPTQGITFRDDAKQQKTPVRIAEKPRKNLGLIHQFFPAG